MVFSCEQPLRGERTQRNELLLDMERSTVWCERFNLFAELMEAASWSDLSSMLLLLSFPL